MAAESAWEALADPTRRQIVQRLAVRDLSAGEVAAAFEISRPGVSRHLRILREAGLVTARQHGQRQVYAICPDALDDVASWCQEIRSFWAQRLDALETEIARGRRDRRKDDHGRKDDHD